LDCRFGIIFRKAEIEVALTVVAGESARTGRKTMYQPRQLAQLFGIQDFWLGFIDANGRHCIMLPDDDACRRSAIYLLALRLLRYSFCSYV
jgi:hypothetical protein